MSRRKSLLFNLNNVRFNKLKKYKYNVKYIAKDLNIW